MKPNLLDPEEFPLSFVEYKNGDPIYAVAQKGDRSHHYSFRKTAFGNTFHLMESCQEAIPILSIPHAPRLDGKLDRIWISPNQKAEVKLVRKRKGIPTEEPAPITKENLAKAGYQKARSIKNPFDNSEEGSTRYCHITNRWWQTEGTLSPFLNYQYIHCQPAGTGEEESTPRTELIELLNLLGPAKAKILTKVISSRLKNETIEVRYKYHPDHYQILLPGENIWSQIKIDIPGEDPGYNIETALCWLSTLSSAPLRDDPLQALLTKAERYKASQKLSILQCKTLNVILEWQNNQKTSRLLKKAIGKIKPRQLRKTLLKAGTFLPQNIWENLTNELRTTTPR